MLSLFSLLDRLDLPEKTSVRLCVPHRVFLLTSSKDKSVKQARTKEIVSSLDALLKAFSVYRASVKSWAELFHRRMRHQGFVFYWIQVSTRITSYPYSSVLTPDKCDHFVALLHLYVKKAEYKDLVKHALDLESFVRTHRFDIDGLIIGTLYTCTAQQ